MILTETLRWVLVIFLLLIYPQLAGGETFLGPQLQWEWDQPEGVQPEGWYVYVSRDGGAFEREQVCNEQKVTIEAPQGQSVVIAVSAFLGGAESEQSDPSAVVEFSTLPPPNGLVVFGVKEVAPGVFVPE